MGRRFPRWMNLGNAIILSTALGVLVGALMGPRAVLFAPLGALFMQLVKMVVVPLVFFSIVAGAASLGSTRSAGKVGAATLAYYLATTLIACTIGILAAEIFQVGAGLSPDALRVNGSADLAAKGDLPGFWETILGVIPQNPFGALASGSILQIIFFALLLGFGISSLQAESRTAVNRVVNGLSDALVWMIRLVMFTAPLGVFGLMADATGTLGLDLLMGVGYLFVVYAGAMALHTAGIYSLAVRFLSELPLRRFWKGAAKIELVALSTSSSMATLPVTMEVCEEDMGVSKETAAFVLPLGATVNMDGSAIYYAMSACFFAQVFGVELGWPQCAAIVATSTVGSIGQAGVPGPSLLVVAVLLSAGIPVEGLPLLFGADRLFDMLRTAVNVTGDASCAAVVDSLRRRCAADGPQTPTMGGAP